MTAAMRTLEDRPHRGSPDGIVELIVDRGLELPQLVTVPLPRSHPERMVAAETDVMTHVRLAEACLRMSIARHGQHPVRGLDDFSPGTAR